MATGKRVLIVGAGASGISSLKTCLEEGLDPICYEAEDSIGGLWRFTEQESHSSVYRSTIINTSKEMMCFTDFPIPEEYPPFMPHYKIIEYFQLYVKHFKLLDRIKFNTRVESISKAEDYEKTGRYVVLSTNVSENQRKTEYFDAVMICSGHHWKPNKPTFNGQESFKGKIIHSHSYKDQEGYQGKNVVVIGIGNSGVDVAVELSRHAKQVYLSTRSGTWLSSRIHYGIPADFLANLRVMAKVPFKVKETLAAHALNSMNPYLENFGLQPGHGVLSAHPTINGELIGRIAVGSVIVKTNIKAFESNTIIFEDGTKAENIDVVILCTGYEIDFPYIDSDSIDFKVTNNEVNLYDYVWIPPKKDSKEKYFPTLCFIGLIQPWGAIMPISEMQARWATRVFKGDIKLPSSEQMWKEIKIKKYVNSRRYKESKRHTIQVDYVEYMDELAAHQGAVPTFWKLLFSYSPLFALKVFFGPSVPAVYRLLGDRKWNQAQDTYNTIWKRNFYPTMTRYDFLKKRSSPINKVIIIIILFLALRFLKRKLYL